MFTAEYFTRDEPKDVDWGMKTAGIISATGIAGR